MRPKRRGDPIMATHARELLNQKGILVVPAVYDALSAKIAERVGFKAVGLGGFLVAASRLGLPDARYLTMSEVVEAFPPPPAPPRGGRRGWGGGRRRGGVYKRAGGDGVFLGAPQPRGEVRRAPAELP